LNSKSLSPQNAAQAESIIPLSLDIISLIISPFVLTFFVESMKIEQIGNLNWILPIWIFLLFSTILDSRVQNNGEFQLSKFHSFFILISTFTFCLFFAATSTGFTGVFNKSLDEENGGSGILVFFLFVILAFIYAGILINSIHSTPKKTFQPPQLMYYLTIIVVPLSTNLVTLFFTAFWIAKFPESENTNPTSLGLKLVSTPLMAFVLLYLCGAPRLILLYKRFNYVAMISLILFYLIQAWTFISAHG
jgi:hypothetical protein